MNTTRAIGVFVLVLCAIFISALCLACEPTYDLAITLPPPETPEPTVESVIGDVSIVYPIVPDDGKEGTFVTLPAATPSPSKATPAAGPTSTIPGTKYTAEMTFTPTDPLTEQLGPKSYGQVLLTVKSAPGHVMKVQLIGPSPTAVQGVAWIEAYMDNNGVATANWKVLIPGEYTASGMLLTPTTKNFTAKLVVK